MSPLWSDMALARAAWANAVERGLVEHDPPRQDGQRGSGATAGRTVRRILRRPLHSCAL